MLVGGAGDDTLTGGAGDDTYHFSEGSDRIHAGSGIDTLVFGDDDDSTGAKIIDADNDGNVDDLRIKSGGSQVDIIDHASGSALSNVEFPDDGQTVQWAVADSFDSSSSTVDTIMVGSDTAETLKTGSGDDFILGNAGADTIMSLSLIHI